MKKAPVKAILASSVFSLGAGGWASFEYTQAEASAEQDAAVIAEEFLSEAPEILIEAEARIVQEMDRIELERAEFARQIGESCMSLVKTEENMENIVNTIESGGDTCPLRDSQIDFLESQYAMLSPRTAGLESIVELVEPGSNNIEKAKALVEDGRINGFWDYTDNQEHSGLEIIDTDQNDTFFSRELGIDRPNMLLYPLSLVTLIAGGVGLLSAGILEFDRRRRAELAIRRGGEDIIAGVSKLLDDGIDQKADDPDDY